MTDDERVVYTLAEVSRMLGVDVRGVARACRAGQIPSVTVGRRVLVPKAKFDAQMGVELPSTPAAESPSVTAMLGPRRDPTDAKITRALHGIRRTNVHVDTVRDLSHVCEWCLLDIRHVGTLTVEAIKLELAKEGRVLAKPSACAVRAPHPPDTGNGTAE